MYVEASCWWLMLAVFITCSSLSILWQGFSLSLELDNSARFAGQQAPGISCLCFPPVVITGAYHCTWLLTGALETWTHIFLLEWKALYWLSHCLHSVLSVFWLLILSSMERNIGVKVHFPLCVSLGILKSLQIAEDPKKNSRVPLYTLVLLFSSMVQNSHNSSKIYKRQPHNTYSHASFWTSSTVCECFCHKKATLYLHFCNNHKYYALVKMFSFTSSCSWPFSTTSWFAATCGLALFFPADQHKQISSWDTQSSNPWNILSYA